MNPYEDGKIYIIELIPFLPYIGSTVQKLEDRFYSHKSKHNTSCSKFLFEVDEPTISLLEEYPCDSRRELEQREQYWIYQIECVNQQRAYRTKEEFEEYRKQHYQQNKQHFLEYKKEWYEQNKEQILVRTKQHYEQNKEQIAKKRRQKITCDRYGSIVRYSFMARHKRTMKCLNFVIS